jgi:glycosyltransferase 2 family protein
MEYERLGRRSVQMPRTRKMGIVRVAFLLVAIGFLVWALLSQGRPFLDAIAGARPLWIAGAFALALLALGLNAMSWREAMASVGIAISVSDALRVFLISQVGKYAPGSIWPVVAQTEVARDRGHSRSLAATGSILAMVIGAAVASVLGAGVVADSGMRSYWWVIPLAVCGVIALTPPVLRRLVGLAFRVTRRREPIPPIASARVAASAAWSVTVWLALGLQMWLLLDSIAPASKSGFVLAVGVFALSWLVGFLIVFAPAGAGAREAMMVAALGSAVTGPQALGVALISRVLMTVADALGVAVALAAGGRRLIAPSRRSSP